MAEQSWHEARLIPTSGINGAEEQERRATSALLAVLGAVKEFDRALRQAARRTRRHRGVLHRGPVPPRGEEASTPTGSSASRAGSKSWTALVEVKTGTNELATEQLENYLDIAREQGFDAVITISNEIPAVAGQHPTKVDKRKTRKVALCTTSPGPRSSPRPSCRRSSAASPTPTRPGSSASSSATSSTPASPAPWSSTTWASPGSGSATP